MTNLYNILKSRDITIPTKVHLLKALVFPVVMYGCESWTIKKAERWRIGAFKLWCWRLLTLKSQGLLDCKEIQPVHSKGDESWVFTGRTDVEPETSILWPPDAKSWLIWKDPCWGFSPRDLEATNLKEWHSDSLLQGLTSLFLQSSLFIEAGTKSLKYTASRAHMGLTHNQ